MTAGELSSFVNYALCVGGNVAALAGVISSPIQVLLALKELHKQKKMYLLPCSQALTCLLGNRAGLAFNMSFNIA